MKKRFALVIIAAVLGWLSAGAQTRAVKGTVSDERGERLVGVSVIEKGTGNGALTGSDGRFSITVGRDAVLQISCLGFESQEVQTGRNTNLFITLKEDFKLLDEVVVVGFATQKKVNLTGSVSTVDSKALESIPVQNAVQALQGQVPGLLITQNNGQLNTAPSINVRGLTTIGEGSSGQVLVLIDGVEGDLSTINPQDIDNISVLKDAAASSIYGSRAPFGVVLVTTKKGRSGDARVNYNNSIRFSTPLNMPHEADSYSWAIFFNDASNNAGWGDVKDAALVQRILDYQNGVISYNTIPEGTFWSTGYSQANDNLDYYDVFYKKVTFSHEHNLSVSGGTDKINYYISGNFLNDGGKMNWGGDGLNRYNVFAKLEAQVKPWMKMNFSSRFTRSDYHQPSHMIDNFFQEIGRQSWPVSPLYDPNGILFNDHVLNMVNGGKTTNQNTVSTNQFGIEIEPVKGWKIIGDASYRYNHSMDHVAWTPYWQTAVDGESQGTLWYQNDISEKSWKSDYANVNLHTDYEHLFGKHYLKLMAGFQWEDYHSRDVYAKKYGIMLYDVATLNTANGLSQKGEEITPEVSGGYASWSTAGFFGRINYNYAEKYLLEANLRYDGTSRFRSGRRWGLFPSFSIGWNIAKEDFFQRAVPWVNTLKLRASYGSLGNQNTNSYYPTYSTMPYANNEGTWLIGGTQPNISWAPGLISTSLTWETVESYNAGIDFVALDGRLSATFDIFERNTLNMVGPADELPVILGTSVPKTNNTNLRTRGFELELGWKDRIGKDFNYSIRALLSDAKGVITKYSNPSGSIWSSYEGMEWGSFWGYETIGIAKTQEEMDEHLASLPDGGQSAIGSNWKAGDIMYKDLNGDGKIDSGQGTLNDHGDLKIIGNTTPRFSYGIDLAFNWKGVDFRMFWQGVGSRQYCQTSRYFFGATSDVWQSMALTQHMDYFRDDPDHPLGLNLDSYYPRPVWGTDKNRLNQTRWTQDASYLRLKNLQIGYTLPMSFTSRFGVDNLRVFVSGENLLTITKMSSIFDPETIDGNSLGNCYPLSRTYSFGVSVSF
ncbi:MAG: TonB-dependent receptor [Bacteroidales bacterium]|nr:TonB-dependent receptor [Bacteroidales bacterium]